MKPLSETRSLAKLSLYGPASLDLSEAYKACVVFANNGAPGPAEADLPTPARQLLEARRQIQRNRLASAHSLLLPLATHESDLWSGDARFLRGLISHREGHWDLARSELLSAGERYRALGDEHRLLRATINARICDRDFASYECGQLYSLRQECLREDLYDLAGNITRARAIELCEQGRFEEALEEALVALQQYDRDGCPEDRAVALALTALLHFLCGNADAAVSVRRQIATVPTKAQSYVVAFEALVAGRRPALPTGHPLTNTPWPLGALKEQSVTGKILKRLRKGPASRDELIELVWGSWAIDPAYTRRLHTAINYLRRKLGVNVFFDGGMYRLR